MREKSVGRVGGGGLIVSKLCSLPLALQYRLLQYTIHPRMNTAVARLWRFTFEEAPYGCWLS